MKITLTKRAEKSYLTIKKYISEKFGETVANAFEDKATNFLELVREFPQIGSQEIKEKQLLGFQLTKATKVFYRIKNNQIIILYFFDVRQSPKKKPQ